MERWGYTPTSPLPPPFFHEHVHPPRARAPRWGTTSPASSTDTLSGTGSRSGQHERAPHYCDTRDPVYGYLHLVRGKKVVHRCSLVCFIFFPTTNMKKIFLLSSLSLLLAACQQASPVPDDATSGEIEMAKRMGMTVVELRNTTPEERGRLMQKLMKKE